MSPGSTLSIQLLPGISISGSASRDTDQRRSPPPPLRSLPQTARVMVVLQEGGLFAGSCLTVRNALSEETHVLTQRQTFWGRDTGGEQQGKGAQENCSATWLAISWFYGDRISFWGVFGQSFLLRVLGRGAHIVQPRWTPAKRILGGGQICGVSF